MPNEIDICIIGAGVVGLAIAAELANPDRRVYIIERNRTFGLETSSHNSEVIHTGIYYPENSLKARFCVEGNPMLYGVCEKYQIGYKRLGKIIVAADDEETKEVERLFHQGVRNGLTDLKLITRAEIKRLEPKVEAVAGLLSPSTGILDSWGLMRSYLGRARENGAEFVSHTEVTGIEKVAGGYKVSLKEQTGASSFTATIVINSAGLYCDKIAALAGIDVEKAGYRIYFAKGEYFAIDPRVGHLVDRLIYPVPEQAGKGIHISVNLEGHMKLGPNVKYVDAIDYSVDEADKINFYTAAHKYLPAIQLEHLSPDFAGIRPKLQAPGEGFRDFIIRDEADKGLPGFIDLIGIESPGLTSSPAIAKYVAEILKNNI
ncbi:MAG: NAD(P)/FAD-dependent oxidoreductase [Dehalococcoidia bacterium]|nr:NAD(P)/FAD-dependent oxidoreductase [Dehalococcoidia bacterium]